MMKFNKRPRKWWVFFWPLNGLARRDLCVYNVDIIRLRALK